jgi:hypothetical protein
MAITINPDNAVPSGYPGRAAFGEPLWNASRRVKIISGTFTLDNSYPTGGWDISAALFFDTTPLKKLLGIIVPATNGYTFVVDQTNKKLMAYTSAGVQTTAATDLSALPKVPFLAWGF